MTIATLATGAIINWFVRSGLVEGSAATREPLLSESTAIDAVVSMYPLGEDHPLVSTFGVFEDDPLWDELIRAMRENREERHQQELAEMNGE